MACGALLAWCTLSACPAGPAPDAPSEPPARVPAPASAPPGEAVGQGAPTTLPPVSPGLRWLAISGGGSALATQVSLEQDLALLAQTLGPAGQTLFAGGAQARGVVVQGADEVPTPADALRLSLGSFLAPGDGRDGSLRAPAIAVDGPTDPVTVEIHVRMLASSATEGPRLLYLGGHGEPASSPLGTAWTAWGNEPLPLASWIAWLQSAQPAPRAPLVTVNTLCFGGGLTQLIFADGDPKAGLFSPALCGVSATTADAPASGCDPNPDRAAQDGYALHVFHALQGLDRAGQPTPSDLDQDGKITLLEAHMHAVVGLGGPDVPLTSSDAYLAWWAAQQPPSPALDGAALGASTPELTWLVQTLSAQLDLAPTDPIERIQARVETADAELATLLVQLDEAAAHEEDAWWVARTALLDRWPELEDPWRPDHPVVLQTATIEIQRFLDEAPEMHAWRGTLTQSNTLALQLAEGQAQLARLRRLLQARQTDARLRQFPTQGPQRVHLDALLACERSVWRSADPTLLRLPSPPN